MRMLRLFAWQMKAISGRLNEGGIDCDNINEQFEKLDHKAVEFVVPLDFVPFQNIPPIAVDRNWFPARMR